MKAIFCFAASGSLVLKHCGRFFSSDEPFGTAAVMQKLLFSKKAKDSEPKATISGVFILDFVSSIDGAMSNHAVGAIDLWRTKSRIWVDMGVWS